MSATDRPFALTVNGVARTVVDAHPGESLLFVLRERLGLPGAKNACEQGECGSCSVLVDDELVCACLELAAAAEGCSVTTVEGLAAEVPVSLDDAAPDATLAAAMGDVQRAFVEAGAVQCGFCTPGFVVAVHHLLRDGAELDEPHVREALSGNLCRCTGYGRILDAVRRVVAERADAEGPVVPA